MAGSVAIAAALIKEALALVGPDRGLEFELGGMKFKVPPVLKVKGTLRDIGVGVPKASVWRRRNAASRLSLLCEASLAVQGPWMAAACRAGMKEPAEKTSWSCAELLEFAP